MSYRASSLFSEKKAAEVAAYFLIRARNRKANITILKLMKLMYLAERLSYKEYGFPIIGDALVSMPHGPVLSRTLELINVGSNDGAWDHLIAEKSDRYVALNGHEDLRVNDLLELSESDIELLGRVWDEFGSWSAIKLRDYTHGQGCPEWQDPDDSSVPIQLETLLGVLGYSPDDVKKITSNAQRQAYINSAFNTP